MTEDAFLIGLAEELYRHREEAKPVRFGTRKTESFEPRPHECHSNVDRWVSAAHAGTKAVRGWLVYDCALSAFPMVRFQAHSVIEEDGRLVDITPAGGTRRALFLRHPDGNEMFDLIVSRRRLISITHKVK